jgi:hypothetical protein
MRNRTELMSNPFPNHQSQPPKSSRCEQRTTTGQGEDQVATITAHPKQSTPAPNHQTSEMKYAFASQQINFVAQTPLQQVTGKQAYKSLTAETATPQINKIWGSFLTITQSPTTHPPE